MKKEAYTNFVPSESFYTEAPLGEWKALAKRIELSLLHAKRLTGKESSVDSEIDKITKEWSSTERERFRHWYKNTYGVNILANSEKRMKVVAQYMPYGSQDDAEGFKKHRLSIVKRIRKLQTELGKLFEKHPKVDWTDATYKDGRLKLQAIQQALNTVSTLLETLQTREVTAAALIRTASYLAKIDPEVSLKFKQVIGDRQQLARIAGSIEVSSVAQELKRELDHFHYGTHLRRMYQIYDRLGKLGLTSLQTEVETVIQKHLPDLTGIHKKLSEIYTEVLEIPGPSQEADKVEVDEAPVAPKAPEQKTSISTPAKTSEFETVSRSTSNIPAATF